MVRTPWGDATKLRERMLIPGSRTPAEQVVQNQRERLFAAMVATVSEKGYEATTVADLLALSGVSRASFYRLFEDRADCFAAMVEAVVEPTIGVIAGSGAPAGEARAREAFDSFIHLVVEQAPAARICFVDVYSAGPRALAAQRRALDAFQSLVAETFEQMPDRQGMPRELVNAIVGGLQRIVYRRLYLGQETELVNLVPEMWEWGLSYLPPPRSLRKPRRRGVAGPATPAGYDEADRILRAFAAVVCERGYPETRITEVCDDASCSHSTFYSHFAGKEEAMLAAIDSGSSQMLAAILPAFRRGSDWPDSVRRAYAAMFAFAAAEPAYTQLGAVEVFAAGRRAMQQRDEIMSGLELLLTQGYELAPETPPIAAEGIGGSIYALVQDQIEAKGPESLPALTPLATYVTLAPFLGTEEACAVANGEHERAG